MNQILEGSPSNNNNNDKSKTKENKIENRHKNLSKISLKNQNVNKKYITIFCFSFTLSIIFISVLGFKIQENNKIKKYSKNFLQNYKILSMYSYNTISNNTQSQKETQNEIKNRSIKKNNNKYEKINRTAESNNLLPPHIIGLLKINKIKLNYPILSETNSDLLKISLCRFAGPNPNYVGNLCIAGHNYVDNRFFSNLNKLNINDTFELYDNMGNKLDYIIYEKYEVEPSNLDCINQNTNGKKIVTLLTCDNVTSKRLVIKGKIVEV